MKAINVIKRCFEEEKKNKRFLICSVMCLLITPIMKLITAFLPQQIYNTIANENVSFLLLLIIAECLLLCFDKYLNSQLNYIRVEARSNQMKKLIALFLEMPYEFIEDKNFDDEIHFAYNSLANPNGYEMVLKSVVDILINIVTLCIFTIILSKVSIIIGLAILTVLIVIVGVSFYSYEDKKDKFTSISNMNRQKEYWNRVAYDYEQGKDIRLYHLLNPILKYYEAANVSYIDKYSKLQKIELKSCICIDILRISLVAFIFYEVLTGMQDYNYFLFYFGVGLTIYLLIESFMESFLRLVDGVATVSGYFEFIDKYQYDKNQKKIEFESLELQNVSFQYKNKNDLALKKINLKINKGDHIAIVGENGAGKSTLIKILSGIYTPTDGVVLLNDDEANVDDLAKLVSTFHQDYHIYAATLKENIIANEELEYEKLSNLSLQMDIDNLQKLKNINFDSQLRKELYDFGTELSGGEAERVATARSFYQNKEVIILDEPFSALDINHIKRTMHYIESISKQKTILVISHHYINMSFYNKIIFIKDGEITEIGTHDELMNKKGDYYSIYTNKANNSRMTFV